MLGSNYSYPETLPFRAERPITEFLFPEFEQHSHPIVQYAINVVHKLLRTCNNCVQDGEFSKVQNIWNPLVTFSSNYKTETKKTTFRYYTAAAIYSQIMTKSFKISENYETSLAEEDASNASTGTLVQNNENSVAMAQGEPASVIVEIDQLLCNSGG